VNLIDLILGFWTFADIYLYPVVIGCNTRHPLLLRSHVIVLSHVICHKQPPPLLVIENDLICTSTQHSYLSFTIPQYIKTLLVIAITFIGLLIANQFNGKTDIDSPWMLRNFLSSLSSSPAVKMPLKAPPKPTVPAAIKSAESATPGEGGECTGQDPGG